MDHHLSLPDLPPTQTRCDVCNNASRQDGDGPLLRCSVCKDRFYCCAACQAQDWKEHKYSCSILPPEGLAPARIDSDQDREKVVRDYGAILQAWTEEHRKIKNSFQGGQLRFASARCAKARALINFTFPENLQCKRHPSQTSKYPYRSTLMLATRVGLMHLISQFEETAQHRLARRIQKAKIPAKWTRLFGPKVIYRPESLAPGEYEVMGTLGSSFLGEQSGLTSITKLMEDKDFWFMLAEAYKELWDAPRNLVYDV
ncbi:hypothetical protein M378DRAFT_157532 [Amanita muscaria Koide BX008]|uniref:MYND-type domain-containing protein n=1 Tax=Amanita muscaria (strain Koide BX008) TaxID=946122 RepID=A0A0C2T0E9_AMAMK|nr:hypothetical protein M378DRAFT_157532 [Amanita muscaria Koide BX008]